MSRKPVKINPIRGKRLKEFCDKKRISQTELSNKIHISQQTISKIINGKSNLTEYTAQLIAAAYPDSEYTFEKLMAYDEGIKTFDNSLEFQKEWLRKGGGSGPLDEIVAEAHISLALEKMNTKGLKLAVNLVETLSEMEDLQKGGNNNGNKED